MLEKIFMEVFADSERFDPLKNFNFAVTFSWKNGNSFMSSNFGFNKVSGLKADVDVVEYREGGDNLSVRKMAGLVKYDPVTLEKGVTDNSEMWEAFKLMFNLDDISGNATEASSADSDGYRGTLVIDLKNRKSNIVRSYELRRAWISTYEVGDLDAQGNTVVVEKITIQHEGFKKV